MQGTNCFQKVWGPPVISASGPGESTAVHLRGIITYRLLCVVSLVPPTKLGRYPHHDAGILRSERISVKSYLPPRKKAG